MTNMESISQIVLNANTRVVRLLESEWSVWGKNIRRTDPEFRYVTSNWDLYSSRFRALCFGLEVDRQMVSFVATSFNKKPKPDGWGPYANNYLAYTPPKYRGNGYVITLNAAVEKQALHFGWKRSTSLAAGFTGFLYQLKAGRTFWGLTLNDELRTDTPLDPANPQVGLGGVPYNARVCLQPHPLSASELIDILSASTVYGHPARKDLKQLLERHPLAYDPTTYKRNTLF